MKFLLDLIVGGAVLFGLFLVLMRIFEWLQPGK
jgi:hypothetical protein